MASTSITSKPFKWLANKTKTTQRNLSLPLFRPSKSSKSPQTLFPNKSWPRKTSFSSREDELQQVFCIFDENKDGKISVEELRAYFVSVGDSMSREEAERVINEFDRDGDNSLEFNEFVELIEQDGNDDNTDYVKKAFEMFEVEKGTGCITPRGLQQVLKRLGNARSLKECKAMIGVYDLDGNGVLDLDEFQRMMSSN